LEFAVQDPRRGILFYTLSQQPKAAPRFLRGNDCVGCHVSLASMDVPGMLIRSIPTGPDGRTYPQFGNFVTDARSPFQERWGGWYVTGTVAGVLHMGNMFLKNPDDESVVSVAGGPALDRLTDRFDVRDYPANQSDVIALLVFDHQMHMMSLLARVGWDARAVLRNYGPGSEVAKTLLRSDARELVDYLLFVDEPILPGRIQSTSNFAAEFVARGPVDKKGRSIRQFDLARRLMRYPCSYMIYSSAFDALPTEEKEAIYRRMWDILSGSDRDLRYANLSIDDRRAIMEILINTKKGLPTYFKRI